MDIMAVIKEHPVPIGIGVLVLLLIMRSSSSNAAPASAASDGTAASLESQQIASGEDVSLAGINAQVTANQSNNNLQSFVATTSAQENDANNRAALIGNIFDTATNANTSIQAQQQSLFSNDFLGALQSQNTAQALSNQLALGTAQINAGVTTASMNNEAAITLANNNIGGQLNALAQNIQYNEATNTLTAQNLPTILQNNQALATISGNTAVSLASLQTAAARTQATTAQNSAYAGLGIAGLNSLGGLFGSSSGATAAGGSDLFSSLLGGASAGGIAGGIGGSVAGGAGDAGIAEMLGELAL